MMVIEFLGSRKSVIRYTVGTLSIESGIRLQNMHSKKLVQSEGL